jgi:ADP-ribose pyrophosphatase YjhB (NUDIX family)
MEPEKIELNEETQLANFHFKMFGVFDDVNRAPRDSVSSIGFYAIVTSYDLIVLAGSDAVQLISTRLETCLQLQPNHINSIDVTPPLLLD